MTTTYARQAGDMASPELELAGAFLDALATGDYPAMAATLAPGATLRALVPSGSREAVGSRGVCGMFAKWFGDAEELHLVDADVGAVAGQLHLRWRFRIRAERLGAGWHVVEQHAYVDLDGDRRIGNLRLLCSGYCPDC